MAVFFEIARAPVFCNVLLLTRDAAIAAETAPIRLGFCPDCEMVYNVAFDPSLTKYSPHYENSLHFSPRFRRYTGQLATTLIDRYDLRGKMVMEIGCGQADFLKLICESGNNSGYGFDPSYDPGRAGPLPENVSVIRETYTGQTITRTACLICCRHVLEHVHQPLEFLEGLRSAIGDRRETIVFFEVPNALWTFEQLAIWDIIYEHCSYFTARALVTLFERAGFEVLRTASAYEGQFLTIEAKLRSGSAETGSSYDPLAASADRFVAQFDRAYRQRVQLWRNRLVSFEADHARPVLWGAGSKGVTFVNVLNVSHRSIPFIVDLNPHKHGRYVPGTGQRVIPPSELIDHEPSAVIIMNPIYRDEIRDQLVDLGVKADVLIV